MFVGYLSPLGELMLLGQPPASLPRLAGGQWAGGRGKGAGGRRQGQGGRGQGLTWEGGQWCCLTLLGDNRREEAGQWGLGRTEAHRLGGQRRHWGCVVKCLVKDKMYIDHSRLLLKIGIGGFVPKLYPNKYVLESFQVMSIILNLDMQARFLP